MRLIRRRAGSRQPVRRSTAARSGRAPSPPNGGSTDHPARRPPGGPLQADHREGQGEQAGGPAGRLPAATGDAHHRARLPDACAVAQGGDHAVGPIAAEEHRHAVGLPAPPGGSRPVGHGHAIPSRSPRFATILASPVGPTGPEVPARGVHGVADANKDTLRGMVAGVHATGSDHALLLFFRSEINAIPRKRHAILIEPRASTRQNKCKRARHNLRAIDLT